MLYLSIRDIPEGDNRMSLKGKVALVTGSTSGIGLGVARALAGAGADIMLNGFGNLQEIEAIRTGLAAEFGVEVAYNGADLMKAEGVAALIRAAEETFGHLDILVNNAGIQHVAPVEDFPAEKWDAVIALNLSAVFHGMKAAIPGMKARGWGRIINIASVHGMVASVNKIAYVAAKHGVLGATKVAALELANSGITVNAICPGWVLTPLVDKQIVDRAAANGTSYDAEKVKLLSEKQPMTEFTTTENLGALAVFLASDAAASMTGVALPMDGGWTAQ
jgi:3-hydroxybutyrate dehydrogenase